MTRKRGRPKKEKQEAVLQLDEYMLMVTGKEHTGDNNDNEYALRQVENTQEVDVKGEHTPEVGVKGPPGSVTCEKCGKVLSKKGHLDRHYRMVHKVDMKIRKRGRPRKGESESRENREAIQWH